MKNARLWLMLMALVLALPFAVEAQDTDGDGIPNKVEEELGTDPAHAEALDLVFDDKSRDEGDKSLGKDNYHASHDMTKIYFGNAGGNRFVWRIDFLAPIDEEQLGLILYLDADGNKKTGRQGVGCEYMFHVGGTTTFTPDGKSGHDSKTRRYINGKTLYFVRDVDLNQADGCSAYQMHLLCETRRPHKCADFTGSIRVQGQGISDRKKIAMVGDATENQNVKATHGFRELERIKKDKQNIVIRIGDCDMDGYMYDIFREYKTSSARVTAAGGSVSFTVRAAGTYYPGFLAYDDVGEEKYALYVEGERKGIAVALDDNKRTWLYWLADPIDFKGGERVTVKAVGPSGIHRIEDMILLKDAPKPRARECTFSDIRVDPLFGAEGPTARVTWISSWACGSVVEYGLDQSYGKRADEDVPAAKETTCNHRVYLKGLEKDKTYHFRVVGETAKGDKVMSKDFTFFTRQPKPFVGSAKRERLPLSFINKPTDREPKKGQELPEAVKAWTDPEVDYRSWPVTSGVPFPKGVLGSDWNVRVLDPAGKEIPLQTTVLARWPDRSIKWLLLDFQADVQKNSVASYVLEYGTQVGRAKPEVPSPLQVKDAKGSVSIVTGPLKVVLSKTKFDLLGKVWLDQNGNEQFEDAEQVSNGGAGAGIFLTGDDGTVYSSLSAPDEVVVEHTGSCRATVRISGVHKAGDKQLFAYVVRINAYAGKPYLRMFHTWGNNRSKEEFTKITNLYLKTPLSGGAKTCALGVDKQPFTGDPAKGEVRLFQNFDDKYRITVAGKEVAAGKRAAGWADVSDGKKGITTAVRHFWELYPKDFIADKAGLCVGICPTLGKDDYAEFPFEKEQHYLYYYLLDGRYKLKQGCTKRHELLYYFHKGDAKTAGSEDLAKCFNRPLMAVAPPEWYCDSKAFYDVAVRDTENFEVYEKAVDTSLARYLQRREKIKEYGMLNFGDWYGERQVNWGNIEYDTQHGMCLQFIRSGDLDFFYTGQQAQQHNMDVDTIHYSKDRHKLGAVYAHCMGHVGSYYRIPAAPAGSPRGGFSVTHTWCEGHLDYYFLTGDQRAFDAAKSIADRYDWLYTREYDFTNGRVPGWHLILTMAMYNATYDPFYLNAAKIIVERVIERQREDGGWRRQMVPGHCYCIPRHHGNAMFMIGILLDGLKYYHCATQDKRVADTIVRGAEYIIGETWEDDPKRYCFRYTSCPFSSKGRGASLAKLHGFAYAYRLSKKPLFKDIVMKGGTAGVRSSVGKGFSSAYRSAPRTLYDIKLWGGQFLPKPPPKFVEPKWYREAIVVQAEDFSGQGGGKVQFRDAQERPTAVGRMITYWHQNLGHWLEWKANVPKAGKYNVIVRYATNCKNTQRDLKVDGKIPHPACKLIRFRDSGGFGVAPDQWEYLTVADEKGVPVALDLSAGEHVIRMTNLNDGLGVDFIALVPAK